MRKKFRDREKSGAAEAKGLKLLLPGSIGGSRPYAVRSFQAERGSHSERCSQKLGVMGVVRES